MMAKYKDPETGEVKAFGGGAVVPSGWVAVPDSTPVQTGLGKGNTYEVTPEVKAKEDAETKKSDTEVEEFIKTRKSDTEKFPVGRGLNFGTDPGAGEIARKRREAVGRWKAKNPGKIASAATQADALENA